MLTETGLLSAESHGEVKTIHVLPRGDSQGALFFKSFEVGLKH